MKIDVTLGRLIFNFQFLFFVKKVLELEEDKGEWGFKALKQMTKINFKIVSQYH